jgi:hypothetical protein
MQAKPNGSYGRVVKSILPRAGYVLRESNEKFHFDVSLNFISGGVDSETQVGPSIRKAKFQEWYQIGTFT